MQYSVDADFKLIALAVNTSVPKGRCGPCFSITPIGIMQTPSDF